MLRGDGFISIDYRTTEELGNVQGMTEDYIYLLQRNCSSGMD